MLKTDLVVILTVGGSAVDNPSATLWAYEVAWEHPEGVAEGNREEIKRRLILSLDQLTSCISCEYLDIVLVVDFKPLAYLREPLFHEDEFLAFDLCFHICLMGMDTEH